MIPSVLASQYREGLKDYMEATYPITSPVFDGSLRRFLDKEDAFFHEPFISVKLPFRVAQNGNERFEAIHPAFPPYVHQNKAYDRLCGDDCQSTLVATGTGSGKSECFMHPILEYCYQHRGEPGIKALIIYPMNALASDQALRIAKLIANSPELHGNVTAGMYVGGSSLHENTKMLPDKLITDHETLRTNPPDILLTNYKMLDYLLVRPKDAVLWSQNSDETLRYIVVDELHTFDGAQGTDLACLLRRLKSRLKIQPGYLCCVGTSATMGGPESKAAMVQYASDVFGEPFKEDAIITEERLSSREFFAGNEVSCFRVPDIDEAIELEVLAGRESEKEYLRKAITAWFEAEEITEDVLTEAGRVQLGQQLMHHSFFQSMMGMLDGRIMQPADIIAQMDNVYPIMQTATAHAVLDSMLALVSHARLQDQSGNMRPFLHVQLQLWMRELRRVLGKVDAKQADLMLEADLTRAKEEKRVHYLPVVNCHDCGATGWVGMIDEQSRVGVRDYKIFYNQFFEGSKKIKMIFPRRENDDNPQHHEKMRFCPKCTTVLLEQGQGKKCFCGNEDTIPVWMPQLDFSKKSHGYICPFCGGTHSIILLGLRSATAISAGISQLYSSHFNDDKKLLAFNDNVQDASHRASFFNARTWRFGLRTAIQHFVCNGGEGMPLADFGRAFVSYWRAQMSDEEFVDTFIPHNMADDRAYEELVKTGEFPDEAGKQGLLHDLEQRLIYESILEYGMNSRLGRTLEKTGASMAAPIDGCLAQVIPAALERIQNEAGIDDLTAEQLEGMLLNWMQHMQKNGAFALPRYGAFVEQGAKSYLLTSGYRNWMPDGYNIPLFPAKATSNMRMEFEFLTARGWYATMLERTLNKTQLQCPGIPEAVSILFSELEKADVLKRMSGPAGLPVFGLNPRSFAITRDVRTMCCDVCGQSISVNANHIAKWTNNPCHRNGCSGHYTITDTGFGHYAELYENGDIVRVHAREHTGLLQREDREELETAFKHKKAQHKAWDPNLLSCTPTLEMGIDIGDLSTVVLCSIPPAQAQYLQRIGRAGRTDGNALTVAMAGAKPHDLYFYQEPLEMIAGKVDPPGVFLNASAVLERQFVAFCFDNWVKSGIPETAIPTKINPILGKIKSNPRPNDIFPFNLLHYIEMNQSQLIRRFTQLFAGQLTDDSKKQVEQFVRGKDSDEGSIAFRILHTFEELYIQRENLKKDIKNLAKEIKKLEELPQDASFDEKKRALELERQGLVRVQRDIEEKNTFNFLSDEGLLPNYAFPEAGVILKAILTRSVKMEAPVPGEPRKIERISYEYGRGASAAISELAPDNSFYADGHKMKIDQIDVTTKEPEPWRFCPDCNHAERFSSEHNVASCPHCGSIKWADQGQVRMMLRVRTVYSTSQYEKSRSGDESDDRSTKFYSRSMLVDIDETKDITSGYQTTSGELPFAYEFVSRAVMREINFGESDNEGQRMTVAGHEEVRKGFKICKYCGKVQPKGEHAEPIHTNTCRAKSQNFKDPFEECMFLYREFTSEAVRILIPATTLDAGSKTLESFAAAVMLGLKEYFGSVEHLQYCVMEAPIPDMDARKQYMVIFDSVPGGTGYLKQLMVEPSKGQTPPMIRLLEMALDKMEHCSCVTDEEKDGCYHCLFAYRQSNKMHNISRRHAAETLRKLLSGKESLTKIATIASLPPVGIDSELEKRFLNAIEGSGTPSRPVQMDKVPVEGKEGYFLQIGNCCWNIELQVPMLSDSGFSVESKPDFVLWPKTPRANQKPIAVFTDGFTYHKDIIGEDTNKRMAIRAHGGYRVWSLVWNDVTGIKESHDALVPERMPDAKAYDRSILRQGLQKRDWKNLSSFELLLMYLADENAEQTFAGYAGAMGAAMLEGAKMNDSASMDGWKSVFRILPDMRGEELPVLGSMLFGLYSPASAIQVAVQLPKAAVRIAKTTTGKVLVYDETQIKAVIRFDDRSTIKDKAFEEQWKQFLYCANMLQFVEDNMIAAESALDADLYSWNRIIPNAQPAVTGTEEDPAWDDIKEQLFAPEAVALCLQLKKAHVTIPEIAYEDEDGNVTAELYWPDKKIAVQVPDQYEFRILMEQDGWQVFTCEQLEIIDLLKEEG